MTSNNTIKAIDTSSIHKITSGQVVIDLQTAVKELVENSLDAGATSVEVRFKQYGLTGIEVIDNGSGIAPEDYDSIALKHHTSKLTKFTDLTTVLSFGFRGEALSSLCALCGSVSVTTARTEEAPAGMELKFDNRGQVKTRTSVARQRGTTVTLSNIFTPLAVRRKELEKNIKREFGKALNLLNAYALVPCTQGGDGTGVRLTVSNQLDGGRKTVQIRTDGTASHRSAISALWGPKSLANLADLDLKFDVESSKPAIKRIKALNNDFSAPESVEVQVKGLTSKFSNGCGRTGTDRQFFYINGRPCNLTKIQKAINEVYRTFSANQSPFLLLDFILPTSSCDINVSPDKRTIFIHSEENLIDSLKAALEEKFASSRSTYDVTGTQMVQSQLPASITHRSGSLKSGDSHSEPLPVSDEEDEVDELQPTPAVALLPQRSKCRPLPRTKSKKLVHTPVNPRDSDMVLDTDELSPPAVAHSPEVQMEFDTDPIVPNDTNVLYDGDDDNYPLRTASSSSLGFQPSESLCSASDDHLVQSTPPTSDRGSNSLGKKLHSEPSSDSALDSGLNSHQASKSSIIHIPPYRFDRRKFVSAVPSSSSTTQQKTNELKQTVLSTAGAFWNTVATDAATVVEDEDEGDADQSPPRKRRRSLMPSGEIVGDNTIGARCRGKDPSSAPPVPRHVGVSVHVHEPLDVHGADNDDRDAETATERTPMSSFASDPYVRLPASGDSATAPPIKQEAIEPSLRAESPRLEFVRSDDADSEEITLRCDISKMEKIYTDYALGLELQQSQPTDIEHQQKVSPDAGVANVSDDKKAADALSRVIDKGDFVKMEIIGQFNLGFIITRRRKSRNGEDDQDGQEMVDDLFIVDQHAADEKYNFETLQQTTNIQSQRLFRPLQLEFTAADELLAIDNIDILKRNGFEIEVDEEMNVGQKLKLTAQPISKSTIFDVKDLEELVHLMHDRPLGHMVRCSKARSMFAMRACRKSVMIGMALNNSQMTTVVKHMGTMDQPWNCPHGRPTMRHLSDISGILKWSQQDKSRKVDWTKLPLST